MKIADFDELQKLARELEFVIEYLEASDAANEAGLEVKAGKPRLFFGGPKFWVRGGDARTILAIARTHAQKKRAELEAKIAAFGVELPAEMA